MKIVGKILIYIQILIFLGSVMGLNIKAHSCLAMHETNYTVGNFNKQDCCNDESSALTKETSIQEVCCSNHEQNIQITSAFIGEKLIKLDFSNISNIINAQDIIKKELSKFEYPIATVFIDPPPLFISNKTIRC